MSRTLAIELRCPTAEDGAAVHQLISQCPPLDTNSLYCNLLQCSHFSQTSVAAIADGEIVGFISGHIMPAQPQHLFIWQVAVGEKARGQGLAKRMLQAILARDVCAAVTHLETTITDDNAASWALFASLAKSLNAEQQRSVMFDKVQHFKQQHDTEFLLQIGPF